MLERSSRASVLRNVIGSPRLEGPGSPESCDDEFDFGKETPNQRQLSNQGQVEFGAGGLLVLTKRVSIHRAEAKLTFEFLTTSFAFPHDRLLVPRLNCGGETSVVEAAAAR